MENENDNAKITNQNDDISETDLDNETGSKGGDDKENKNPNPNETGSKPKPKQDRETNAYYAALRRKNKELEEQKKALEEDVKNADFNARARCVSNDTLNEIGLDKISNKEELLMAEAYERAVKNDSDNPLKEANKVYRDAIKKHNEELAAKEKDKSDHEKLIANDEEKFFKKYGKHIVDLALNDETFVKTFGNLIKENKGNITELYEMYQSLTNKGKADDKEKNKQNGQNMGVLPNSSSQPPANDNDTKLDSKMSDEEYIKAFNKKYGR